METAKPSTKKAKTSTKTAKPPPLPATPVGTRYEVSMRPESKPDKYLTIMSWNVAGARPPGLILSVLLSGCAKVFSGDITLHGSCRPASTIEKGCGSH